VASISNHIDGVSLMGNDKVLKLRGSWFDSVDFGHGYGEGDQVGPCVEMGYLRGPVLIVLMRTLVMSWHGKLPPYR